MLLIRTSCVYKYISRAETGQGEKPAGRAGWVQQTLVGDGEDDGGGAAGPRLGFI